METLCRVAGGEDWTYIDALRKRESSALGFLPKDAYLSVLLEERLANRDRWRTQRIWVAEDNGDTTGFVYASFVPPTARVIQIAIQEDARRWYRALNLLTRVETLATERGCTTVRARVAADLEATAYWSAMGYTVVGETEATWLNQRKAAGGRLILLYEKNL